jgi:Family of unknown function (DUF5825)
MTLSTPAGVVLTGWRHHDQLVADLPGIALAPEPVPATAHTGQTAADLYAHGARRVAVDRVVDLTDAGGPADLRALALVRELTSRGVVVDWQLRLPPDTPDWWLLNHLQPPSQLHAGPAGEQLRQAWADSYYLDKCIFRNGPGFIQVRDRRSGELNRLTIDEPDYLEPIDRLSEGVAEAAVPPHVVADFAAEGLLWSLAGTLLWLPYRVRRWPWPAMLV